MVVKFVNVSADEVGTLCVLQTKVVPTGFVPVSSPTKFTVVTGQILVEVAGIIGAFVLLLACINFINLSSQPH